MKITLQSVSIALDVIYTNALKSASDQLSLSKLQKESGLGIQSFLKLRQELISRNLLQVFGQTRSQYTAWNTCKCGMNPTLVKDVYKTLYTSEIKQEKKKSKPKLEYKEVVDWLQSKGWRGTLERVKDSDLIQSVERLHI